MTWRTRSPISSTCARLTPVGHSPAVAVFAEATAHKLGLSSAEAVSLRQAGLLHDLGAGWGARLRLE